MRTFSTPNIFQTFATQNGQDLAEEKEEEEEANARRAKELEAIQIGAILHKSQLFPHLITTINQLGAPKHPIHLFIQAPSSSGEPAGRPARQSVEDWRMYLFISESSIAHNAARLALCPRRFRNTNIAWPPNPPVNWSTAGAHLFDFASYF